MGPRTWADALASLPGGVREVSGGCGRGRRAPQLKLRPLPFSSLLLSSVLPSSAFIPVFSLPHPALCPVRCQKGPVSVPWQRQRLAAPAASAVSLHFVSGAQGPGRAGHTHTCRDGSQASGRNAMGRGRSHPWGVTQHPWKSLASAIDVLGLSRGEEAWWGRRGRGLLAHVGGALGGEAAAQALVRGGGRRLCMDGGLAASLHFGSASLSSESASGACSPSKEPSMPCSRRTRDLPVDHWQSLV